MLTLPPLEIGGRLALAVGLAIFLGLAFEETYKAEERSNPGGIRTFPMLTMCGAALYIIEPVHAFAFIAGLLAMAGWLFAYLRVGPLERETPSLMIPASNLLAYVIGSIAVIQPPWVAVALTVTAVLLLGARERLHRLIHIIPRNDQFKAAVRGLSSLEESLETPESNPTFPKWLRVSTRILKNSRFTEIPYRDFATGTGTPGWQC